jgi:hypothetical protein
MVYDIGSRFLSGDQIEVFEKNYGGSAVFKYYDDDPELYMLSCDCGNVGLEFELLEAFFDTAALEFELEQREEDEREAEAANNKRLSKDLAELHEACKETEIRTMEAAWEFFHERDKQILDESPESFFQPLDMRMQLPENQSDYSGAQFYLLPGSVAEEMIPAELKEQMESLYETRYSFRLGYPVAFFDDPLNRCGDEWKYNPDYPRGILFMDKEHVRGIIQFDKLKRHFAEEWNRHRSPESPQLYCIDSGRMVLVKQFDLAENGTIADPDWESFFNVFPSIVMKQYNEFLHKLDGETTVVKW